MKARRKLGLPCKKALPGRPTEFTHPTGAANILRGKNAGQDYKNYILSLMFYKRLSDQSSPKSPTTAPTR